MSRPPREFNYDLATPTQVLEEADRRCRNRLAGRNPTDDGPPTTPAARSIERAERAIEFARSMLTPVPSFEDMRGEARAAGVDASKRLDDLADASLTTVLQLAAAMSLPHPTTPASQEQVTP